MSSKNEIRNFILKEIFPENDQKKFQDDTDLIEKGILDSFAMLQLMTHLEETYQIEVGFDEMVSENIRSITLLADFVNRKLGN
jgi:acyl carrier protein